MKEIQIKKLYNKLTPQEQATLIFEAVIRKNEDEADLILASVEKRTYKMVHGDYFRRMSGLSNLAGCYGLVYWKTLCQLGASTAFSLNGHADFVEPSVKFNKKIGSMNAALKAVCKKLKVDVSAVKRFAECSDGYSDFENEVDDQLIEYYTELFSKAACLI